VVGIEQAVEIATAVPAHVDFSRCVQRLQDAPDGCECVSIELPALEIRNRLVRDASAGGKINLSPAAPLAQDEDRSTDARIVSHRQQRGHTTGYRMLSAGLPATDRGLGQSATPGRRAS
jgi:hypothetical protein